LINWFQSREEAAIRGERASGYLRLQCPGLLERAWQPASLSVSVEIVVWRSEHSRNIDLKNRLANRVILLDKARLHPPDSLFGAVESVSEDRISE
jgi:hypothetical protein